MAKRDAPRRIIIVTILQSNRKDFFLHIIRSTAVADDIAIMRIMVLVDVAAAAAAAAFDARHLDLEEQDVDDQMSFLIF
jgi:hypothetical protein